MPRSSAWRALAALATTFSAATLAIAPAAQSDSPADEQSFVTTIKGPGFPCSISGCGLRLTDAELLARGYTACSVMDQYPDQSMRVYYEYWDDPASGNRPVTKAQFDSLVFAAGYLCQRHQQMYPQVYGG